MRNRAAMFAVSILVAGCGSPFLHPAGIAAEYSPDPGLVGEWATDGPTVERAVITAADTPGTYNVALTVHHNAEFKTALALDLALTRIGGDRYADVYLSRPERDKLVTTYGFLAVPVHQIMKFARDDDVFKVWSFDGAWLEARAKPGMYEHGPVTVGGGEVTLVTAPTQRVRELIARQGNVPGTFAPPVVFRRVVVAGN